MAWFLTGPDLYLSMAWRLGTPTVDSSAPDRSLWQMGVGMLPNFSRLLEPDVALSVARASWF